MEKLLVKYSSERSLELARKIRAHNFKHPMSGCMLTALDAGILRTALEHAERGDDFANTSVK